MLYLIGQIIVWLLLAGLIGLGLGYVLWGMLASRRRVEIETLNKELGEKSASHASAIGTLTTRVAELEPLPVKVNELTEALAVSQSGTLQLKTAHAAAIAEKDSDLNGLQQRIVALEPLREQLASAHAQLGKVTSESDGKLKQFAGRIADLEGQMSQQRARAVELETNLRLKDSEIAGHLRMHAEKDRVLAGLRDKIGQLEPLAAQVPELESAHASLQQKISDLEPVAAKVPELESAHALALSEKDTLQARLAELEPVSQDSGNTFFGKLGELKAAALEAIGGALDSHSGDTAAERTAFDERLRKLQADLAAKDSELQEQLRLHAEKDDHLARLQEKLNEFQPIEASAGASAGVPQSLASAAGAGLLAGYMLKSPQPDGSDAVSGSERGDEFQELKETVQSLLGPLPHDLVAPMAAKMATGSDLEDWLQAERVIRSERLERVRLQRLQTLGPQPQL